MDHRNVDNALSTTLMLPKDGEEKVVAVSNGVGKILIREDTILANIQGCAGCGKARFTCSGAQKQWSVLCWGRQTDKKYYTLLVMLSATFVLSVIGTILFCFTNTLNEVILSNMVIRNNSIAYSVWKRPNVQPLMKVHLFNYTNWRRFKLGFDQKLHLQDVGPYVYSQQLERVNVEFNGEHLSFEEKNEFRLNANRSAGTQYDQVTVPNLILLGLAKVVQGWYAWQKIPILAMVQSTDHRDPFIQLPVHSFIWGYNDDIFETAKPFLSIQGQLKMDRFGLLSAKNDTLSDRLTINTGETNLDKMNIIEKFKNKEKLDTWGSPECNSLESTDGSIFPPSMLDRKTVLYVFYPNLCRRLPFHYEKDIEVDGIPLLRYRLPSNIFEDPPHNPDNQCYCHIESGVCPPRGVINVTACAMGAPALASFPHFYLGDKKLFKHFTGLKPDPSTHENYLDIHPTLGIALSGKSSLQINIQVKKSDMFTAISFLEQDMILPVAWIEMTVEEIPESLRTLIYHGTYSTAAVKLGLAAISVASLIVSAICLFTLLVGKRQKPCATVKLSMDTEAKRETS